MRKYVGIVGGAIGHDPFDRRTWSGTSYFLFDGMRRQGCLHRAFGVALSRPRRALHLTRNFARDRRVWRKKFYADPRYRAALSTQIRRNLTAIDFDHTVLQIGAGYNAPDVLDGRAPCYTYNDGNLVETIQSPYWGNELNARQIDRAIAYERQVQQAADRVLTMSEYLRQSFIANYDLPADRVVNVGGGINFDPVPTPVDNKIYDSNELLYIGVEFGRKGGWQLLEAFQQIRHRYGNAQLHIVGPTALQIPPNLESGVHLHGHLKKTNAQDQKILTGLFERCSLFVMPSLYEPFGIAPLEALAHEIPCVVTNRWALGEAVRPGITGEVVEPGNVEELATKILGLLANPGQLQVMGRNGRQLVLDRYTWDAVSARLSDELTA